MVIEKQLSSKSRKNAVDLIVTLVIDELSEDLQLPVNELLPMLAASKTGKLLYDESSKLWWSGPSDIVEMFKKEIES